MSQQVTYTDTPARAIAALGLPAPLFALCDTNTEPMARDCCPQGTTFITIPPGDDAKTLDTCALVWQALQRGGATRRSAMVNVGGGMVTDLGGFCAATFKRGMRFVNVPTTLLGAVDAAVGGKTGINFGGLKNEIGVFCEATDVVITPAYLASLPRAELLSGAAEMLKHTLISGAPLPHRLDIVPTLQALRDSVEVKRRIVALDPLEQGPRKALNLGHTAGHAIESWRRSHGAPAPHGYCVAWGLVAALVLSRMQAGLEADTLYSVAALVRDTYGHHGVPCSAVPELLELMAHDKKNARAGHPLFTLLQAPGTPLTDRPATPADITAALDIASDLLA